MTLTELARYDVIASAERRLVVRRDGNQVAVAADLDDACRRIAGEAGTDVDLVPASPIDTNRWIVRAVLIAQCAEALGEDAARLDVEAVAEHVAHFRGKLQIIPGLRRTDHLAFRTLGMIEGIVSDNYRDNGAIVSSIRAVLAAERLLRTELAL